MPRAVHHIFDYIKQNPNKGQFRVTLSFLEIYMEQITDLLEPSGANAAFGKRSASPRPRTARQNASNTSVSSVSPHRAQNVSPIRAINAAESGTGLQIREDPKTGIFVEGLTQVHVKTKEQLLQFVK